MSFDETVSKLIGDIYDAAMAPRAWPAVLDRISAHFCASTTGLLTEHLHGHAANAIHYTDTRADPQLRALFEREFSQKTGKNPGYNFYPLFPLARPVLRTALQDDDAFCATEMYQRWMRPMNIFYIAIVKLLATADNTIVSLHVGRGRDGEDFSRDDRVMLEYLAPHLRRAVQMQRRFALAEAEKAGLDGLPWSIVYVDAAGAVLSCNAAASEMFTAGDGLSTRRGQITAAQARETAGLLAAIRQAAVATAGEAAPPAALALQRPSGRRPLAVVAAPVRRPAVRPGEAPAVVLFIADPERRAEPCQDVVRRLYGLTPAEARLACALLDADRLDDAAKTLGIGLSTAKTQLQAIFSKTGTCRQTQVVRLLLSGPAALRLT
jgi:DNA-binding CsgD family transcriptional regulator